MPNLNRILLIGHLTRDPELKDVGSTQLCTFGLATTTKFSKDKSETCFIDVKCWGNRAPVIAQYFQKGSAILVEGRLSLEQWEDQQSGQKRSKHTINCSNFEFMGKSGNNSHSANTEQSEQPMSDNGNQNGYEDDQCPF